MLKVCLQNYAIHFHYNPAAVGQLYLIHNIKDLRFKRLLFTQLADNIYSRMRPIISEKSEDMVIR